jgi:hypothetical protein
MNMDSVARLAVCVLHDLPEAVGLRVAAGGLNLLGRYFLFPTQDVYHVGTERFPIPLLERSLNLLIGRFVIQVISKRFIIVNTGNLH